MRIVTLRDIFVNKLQNHCKSEPGDINLKMGVPKFYRWLSERYPCLSEVVKEYQIPEFDNLYLDMNGIIHICSHPNDDDPHFRISEEKIFQDIFHYIEFLFRMVQPRKVNISLPSTTSFISSSSSPPGILHGCGWCCS